MNRREFLKLTLITIGAATLNSTVALAQTGPGPKDTILTPINATENLHAIHIHGKQRNTPWPWRDNHRTIQAYQRGDMERFWNLKASQTVRYAAYLERF